MGLGLVISYLLAYGDGTECSETSAYKIQAPGNYTEENTQHTEHGESLKSRIGQLFMCDQGGGRKSGPKTGFGDTCWMILA
jgi:hypothetical protein